MYSAARPYSRQERSLVILERIVRAANEIIAEKGESGLTVAKMTKRSGISVNSFYNRFPSKDALLAYLNARFL